jgi:hypothetical protein
MKNINGLDEDISIDVELLLDLVGKVNVEVV